jgi:hypothetical protein
MLTSLAFSTGLKALNLSYVLSDVYMRSHLNDIAYVFLPISVLWNSLLSTIIIQSNALTRDNATKLIQNFVYS